MRYRFLINSIRRPASIALVACAVVLATGAASADAASPTATWGINAYAYPSDFSAKDNAGCSTESSVEAVCDTYVVTATDIGAKATSFSSVTIEDNLPAGVTAGGASLLWTGLRGLAGHSEVEDLARAPFNFCMVVPSKVRCVVPGVYFGEVGRSVHPDDTLRLWISTKVNEPVVPGPLTDTATVSGGGVSGNAETSVHNTLAKGAPAFGPSAFSSPFLAPDGTPETQAGGHPYELATNIDLASVLRESPEGSYESTTVHDVRDIVIDLPLGVAGSAVSAPTCTLHQLASKGEKGEQGVSACPSDTIVGHIRTYPTGFLAANSAIYNIVPEHGVAAEFGFVSNANTPIILYASIAPTPSGYVLRTTSAEVVQVPLTQVIASIYGEPAVRDGSGEPVVPTFTNPENCSGEPLKTVIHMDSWPSPGSHNADGTPNFADPNWIAKEYESPPVTGCSALEGLFKPEIETHVETPQADSPTGLEVDLKIPQQEGAEKLATPPLKELAVTLPEGLTVNPSSANGLAACSEAQIGWLGKTPASTGELEDFNASPPEASEQEELEGRNGVPGEPARCPKSSRIGTIEVETPALPAKACKEAGKGLKECPAPEEQVKTPLEGSVYLATQNENPFGSLIAAYFVINDPRTGVIVKLPAKVELNESTGQLTTIVKDSPQFPFSVLRTHIFGGATASLSTPLTCGTYTLTSQLTPWSSPESGGPATPSSSFEVAQGVGGGACPGTPPFGPSFGAGTSSSQAGAYAPLNASFSRQDGEQILTGISVTTPPGLLGSIKNVVQCPEPQASQGNCGPESLIGEATTAVGAGSKPYWVHGGKVYLTGPYNNGPFGLSIVVPTTAGPFTLTGNAGFGREVVRSSIRVDPATAQITVVSDPLPQRIQGIPLQVRTINVSVNRSGFTFNPTSCNVMSVHANLTSAQGATVSGTAPFKAQNCASLPFHPTLSASTQGKASRQKGASLNVRVTSGSGQANIAKTDLTLPIQLPSRLTTIQKACLAATFAANPAACDEGSVIGTAVVHTPLLKSTLTGPAYLISHGGAAFPDVEFVLQGEGITLILDGHTDIKKGITYSRFETVPDAPVETFEAVLPTGPHSALGANLPHGSYNFCGTHLVIPTVIVGQNGAVISQNTKVTVTGCPKSLTNAQKLAAALKLCHKNKKKSVRTACERRARQKYGAKPARQRKK
jgi:hypothetical protein